MVIKQSSVLPEAKRVTADTWKRDLSCKALKHLYQHSAYHHHPLDKA